MFTLSNVFHTFDLNQPSLVDRCAVVDGAASVPLMQSTSNVFFDALRSVSVPDDLNWGDGMRLADKQLRPMLPHAVQREFVLDNLVKSANGKYDNI